jgi:DNA repair protein RadC
MPAEAKVIIAEAKRRMSAKLRRGSSLSSPGAAREAIHLKLAECEHEVFACLFLDNQHRMIQYAELFRGTIDGASVYPREVVKATLACNAAAVIFCHNHPSGLAEPSEADKFITQRLKQALGLLDIRVLDHFVIGSEATYSFAEHGLL